MNYGTDPKHWFLIKPVATEVPYSGVIGICLVSVMNCVSGEVKLPQLMEDDNDTEMQPIHTVYRYQTLQSIYPSLTILIFWIWIHADLYFLVLP